MSSVWRVRAYLGSSMRQVDPWSPMLDRMIMWAVARDWPDNWEAESGLRPLQPPEAFLPHVPLAVVRAGDCWWFACTCPLLPAASARWVAWSHKRFDLERAWRWGVNVRRVNPSAGPYKDHRLRNPMVSAHYVQWVCEVDGEKGGIDRLRDLLDRITAVGGKRGAGCGQVLAWEVEELVSPEDVLLARFLRPVPLRAVQQEPGLLSVLTDVQGMDGQGPVVMDWTWNQPGWQPAQRQPCLLPVPGRLVLP